MNELNNDSFGCSLLSPVPIEHSMDVGTPKVCPEAEADDCKKLRLNSFSLDDNMETPQKELGSYTSFSPNLRYSGFREKMSVNIKRKKGFGKSAN